jgi:hypothetical protein
MDKKSPDPLKTYKELYKINEFLFAICKLKSPQGNIIMVQFMGDMCKYIIGLSHLYDGVETALEELQTYYKANGISDLNFKEHTYVPNILDEKKMFTYRTELEDLFKGKRSLVAAYKFEKEHRERILKIKEKGITKDGCIMQGSLYFDYAFHKFLMEYEK